MRKACRGFLLGLMLVGSAVSCKKNRHEAHEQTLGVLPRVVSLSPSTTESVWALGAGAQLVGRSAQCDFPPRVLALPVVGNLVAPNTEAIVGLHPSLVVGDAAVAARGLGTQLSGLGIASYFSSSESVSDVRHGLLGLGERLGRAAEAKALVRQLEDDLAHLVDPSGSPARVLVLVQVAPIFAVGPKSYLGELLALAGGANVLREGAYPQLSLESLLGLAPDVIVLAHGAHEPPLLLPHGAPGWSQMAAVKKSAICTVGSDALMRPGPRMAEGAKALQQCLTSLKTGR